MSTNPTFDPEAFRRKISESRTSTPDDAGDNEVELNPLARKIAQQFREDTYSPAMITGLLRLGEFVALVTLGYIIHALYLDVSMRALYVAVLVGGAGLGIVLLQLADAYRVPALRLPLRMTPRILGSLGRRLRGHGARALLLQIRRPLFPCLVRLLVRGRRRLSHHRAAGARLCHPPLGAQRHRWSGVPSSSAAASRPRS